MKITLTSLAVCTVLAATSAWANPADNTFALKAAKGGSTEVEAGRLAQDKGDNPSIRKFGGQMISDHSAAGKELNIAASIDKISIPQDAMNADQEALAKLSGLSGEAFDVAYAAMMVKDHEDTISLFEEEASSGSGELKAFATKTLPKLKMHLQMARELDTGN